MKRTILLLVIVTQTNLLLSQLQIQGAANDKYGETMNPSVPQTIRRVGIGDFSNLNPPAAAFHINANLLTEPLVTANNTFLAGEVFRTSGPSTNINAWRLFTGPGNGSQIFSLTIPANSLDAILSTEQNGAMRFRTNGMQRMFIANGGVTNGFVGIGSGFNAPVSLLHINSLNNGTGEVFRTTAPAGVDHTWRMNTVFDAFRFYIQNPANTVEARLVNEVDGEINFFTNFSGSGGARSMSIQGGIGNVVHGQVAFGNALPANFNAQSRLHLHQTTIAPNPNPGANFIQFTSTNTTGADSPGPNTGFQVGIVNPGDAFIRQNENAPIRFTTGGPFVQRMIILGNVGGADEGYIGMNTVNPTSRLDINGNLRIRLVDQQPAHALFVGVQHTPGTLNDLDVRRLDFNGNTGNYLSGNGTWESLPPPSGVNANNGVSYSTTNPNTIALGQTLFDANDPAALLNNREVPMNNFNIHFTDDNAVDNGFNRIVMGPSTSPAIARLNVHVNPAIQQQGPVGLFVTNSQTSLSTGIPNKAIRGVVSGINQQNMGLDMQVSGGTIGNTGVDVVVNSPVTGTGLNIGGTYLVTNGARNQGVGGRAISDNQGQDNIGVSGYAQGNNVNNGGKFIVQGLAVDNVQENYGVWGETIGIANGRSFAIYGRTLQDVSPNSFAGYFDGNVHIQGTGTLTGGVVITSDQIFKTNIQDISGAMNIINALQPRTFEFDTVNYSEFNFESDQQMGLVAQEVEQVIPAIVSNHIRPAEYDSLGNMIFPDLPYLGIEYEELIPLLIAGMQEQQAELDEKDSIIASINNRLDLIEQCLNNAGICNANFHTPEQITEGEQQRVAQSIAIELRDGESIVLEQNVPNPFAERTVIDYNIPSYVGKAEIYFYDARGILVNSVSIPARGAGHLNVYAADLSTGIYSYSLIADGKVVSTKKMMKE